MTGMDTTPDTDRYRCVVDGCDWTLGHRVGSGLPDGPVQADPGATMTETIANALRRSVDRELRGHLETHDVVEFVRTITRLRNGGSDTAHELREWAEDINNECWSLEALPGVLLDRADEIERARGGDDR